MMADVPFDTQEVKTTWHPLSLIERGQGGGGGY
jgi:hypothetical protein